MWDESAMTAPPGTVGPRARSSVWPLLISLCFIWGVPALAQDCNSAPLALNDQTVHEGQRVLIDVLANDVEPDGEAMTVTTGTTTCDGAVSEDFGLVSLEPAVPGEPEVCEISYQVADEQGNTASATVFVSLSPLIFQDGFESGDTSVWSAGER